MHVHSLEQHTQSTRIEFNPTIVEASVMVEEINFQYNGSEEFTSINVSLESSFSVTKVIFFACCLARQLQLARLSG